MMAGPGAAAPTTKLLENVTEESETLYTDDGFNPMVADFERIGIHDDLLTDLMGSDRAKDTPCKFHDGFSGTCWKGSSCIYSHAKHTGGVFAKHHPEIAFATLASQRKMFADVIHLPVKPLLTKEAQIMCTVTHIESPSNFYIKFPANNPEGKCICDTVDEKITKWKDEGKAQNVEPSDLMAPKEETKEVKPIQEELTSLLSPYLTYKKSQRNQYDIGAELVAVRDGGSWWRAVVQSKGECGENGYPKFFHVQILETGKKLKVSKNDICQLPLKFGSYATSAFKCTLFGVSPIWGHWAKSAIRYFETLVKDKEVRVVVKEAKSNQEIVRLFEKEGYTVDIIVKQDEEYVNVADLMEKIGYCLFLNHFPHRPLISKLFDGMKINGFLRSADEVSQEDVQDAEKRLKRLFEDWKMPL